MISTLRDWLRSGALLGSVEKDCARRLIDVNIETQTTNEPTSTAKSFQQEEGGQHQNKFSIFFLTFVWLQWSEP